MSVVVSPEVVGASVGGVSSDAPSAVPVVPVVGELVSWQGRRCVWISRVQSEGDGVRGWIVVLEEPFGRVCVSLSSLVAVGDRVGVGELLDVVVGLDCVRAHRLSELEAAAHEWADDNDLCERFDDFMEEMGLSRRVRDFEVEVQVCVRGSVSATSEDAAYEVVEWAEIQQWMEEGGVVDWDVHVDAV